MAKLYFRYSAMDAGKSTILLQTSHNYIERGMNTFLLTAAIDDRFGAGKITSRLGVQEDARVYGGNDDLLHSISSEHASNPVHCVLVDEAQFLSEEQVYQLSDVVDKLDIPVICFGLRTDFRGNLFEGSQALLSWADEIEEIKTICECGRKATMVIRLGPDGIAVSGGEQVEIGDNTVYRSVCRRHHKAALETGALSTVCT